MSRRLALPLLTALLACATASSEALLGLTPVPESSPDLDFQAMGEVLTRDSSAAFSDWRVVGPHVNLTRQEDGTWAGDIAQTNVVLTSSVGRLSGANADLHFLRWGDEVVVRGHLAGRGINIRLRPGDGMPISGGIACRYEGNLVDCDRQSATVRPGIELRGLAARTRNPVMPQLGLALLAVRGTSVIMH